MPETTPARLPYLFQWIGPAFPDATLTPDTPNGSNGWYNSAVTVTANSSDATSGLASQAISLDGSTWMPALTLSTDGVYTVQVSAKDNAGNTASATKTVKLDSTPPAAAFQVPAADGSERLVRQPGDRER